MKKIFLSISIVVAATVVMASCGNKNANKSGSAAGGSKTEAVIPDGFRTHEFTNFSISVPEEFSGSEIITDVVRFSSEARLTLDNGDEVCSSAIIDCSFMTGGATPSRIKETASTIKYSQEATGETCEEPVIEGNTILMRHYSERDGGSYKYITWRWWIVSKDGKNIAGNISYPDTQAKYYDPIVKAIVKSIKIK